MINDIEDTDEEDLEEIKNERDQLRKRIAITRRNMHGMKDDEKVEYIAYNVFNSPDNQDLLDIAQLAVVNSDNSIVDIEDAREAYKILIEDNLDNPIIKSYEFIIICRAETDIYHYVKKRMDNYKHIRYGIDNTKDSEEQIKIDFNFVNNIIEKIKTLFGDRMLLHKHARRRVKELSKQFDNIKKDNAKPRVSKKRVSAAALAKDYILETNKKDLINESMIQQFMTKESSKELFLLRFPFLKPAGEPEENYMIKNVRRYSSKTILLNGNEYYITNDIFKRNIVKISKYFSELLGYRLENDKLEAKSEV